MFKFIKRLTGFKFTPLYIGCTVFEGYSLHVFEIGTEERRGPYGMLTGDNHALFSINYQRDTIYDGDKILIYGCFLFVFRGIIYQKTLKESMRECRWCETKVPETFWSSYNEQCDKCYAEEMAEE